MPIAGQRQSLRWIRNYQRKCAIYAEARYLLARMGAERFSVRRLAERCELTTQSIYNIVGQRSQIVVDALRDHTNAVFDAAVNADPSLEDIFAVDEIYLETTHNYPEFILNCIKFMTLSHEKVRQAIYVPGWMIREQYLRRLFARGRFGREMDFAFVAQKLTFDACALSQEWFYGHCDKSEHSTRHRWSAGATLYRYLTDAERKKIEPMLDAHGALADSYFKPGRIAAPYASTRVG